MPKFQKVLNNSSRKKEIVVIDRYLSNALARAKESGEDLERCQKEYDDFQKIKEGDFYVVALEKLDGENFRVGYDKERGRYIGQRNNAWNFDLSNADGNHHPHWNKINLQDKVRAKHLQDIAQKMVEDNYIMHHGMITKNYPEHELLLNKTMEANKFLVLPDSDEQEIVDVAFFGELCGNSLQKRFEWRYANEQYGVHYYDAAVTVRFKDDREDMEYILGYRFMQYIQEMKEIIPLVPQLGANAIKYKEVIPWLQANVDTMKPITPLRQKGAPEGERGIGEGWVVVLPWPHRYDRSIRVKIKSERFAEQNKQAVAKDRPQFDSQFSQFITKARVEHGVQSLAEAKGITTEEVDIRMTGDVIKQTLADVAAEENGGEPLPKQEVKACSGLVARIFKLDILK